LWIYLGIGSAFFLGLYDISKKHAVSDNAVLPVLFFSTLAGALLMVPGIVLSRYAPGLSMRWGIHVPEPTLVQHRFIFVKALIVSTAWGLTFFGLKHLPISIAAPIAASGPIWTLIGALVLFHEELGALQWVGMAVSLAAYGAFQTVGQKEGISFHKNSRVLFVVLGTVINAASALYDKFLIQTLGIAPNAVQAWFMAYMVPVFGLEAAVFHACRGRLGRKETLVWRPSIPLAGALLIAADSIYFRALRCPGSLIALLTMLRRSSVVLAFVLGGRLFREVRLKEKALALAGILLGIVMILLSP